MAAFMDPLPVTAELADYEAEAEALARAGTPDAHTALAERYGFRDWDALVSLVTDLPPFEFAAEAVIDGQIEELRQMLGRDPSLIHARSTRVTSNNPPVHGATLLHYIAANGVESYRQRTPPNAVAIARLLLDSGADPNALASMYGGEHSTLPMLVSSTPPADAGLQVALAEVLLDYGAAIDGVGTGAWTSPLMTALVFGFSSTAEMLVRRGARRDRLAAAAGLGRLDESASLLPHADSEERHRALALAAQLGHADVVKLLLDAGEDPDRYNPPSLHAHATPMHQAALNGHLGVVRVLAEHGAKLDIKDRNWHATPLGWADYAGRKEVADYLRQRLR